MSKVQYYTEDDQIKWRDDEGLPPHKLLIVSPDDIEARNRTKRESGHVISDWPKPIYNAWLQQQR